MNKIISFALAFAMLVGVSVQNANASVTASGYFMITGDAMYNQANALDNEDTTLHFYERVQFAFDVDMKDDVKAQISFRLPQAALFGGSGVEPDDLSSSNSYLIHPQLRSAYVAFPLANFDITAGFQAYTGPSYFGSGVNPVLDDLFPGFVVSREIGIARPELAWFITEYERALDRQNIYSFSLPLGFDKLDLTPWVTMIDSGNKSSELFAGATFDSVINDIYVGAGAIYVMDFEDKRSSGYVVEGHFALDLAAVTPGLAAWYGSSEKLTSTEWGSWLAFNNSGDYMYGNGNGLQSEFTSERYDPFSSLGVAFSLADIELNDTLDLNARAVYVKDTTKDKTDSRLEFGASVWASVTENLNIILDVAYFMPMYEEKAGNSASLACTIFATF